MATEFIEISEDEYQGGVSDFIEITEEEFNAQQEPVGTSIGQEISQLPAALKQSFGQPLESMGETAQVAGFPAVATALKGAIQEPEGYVSAGERFMAPKEGEFQVAGFAPQYAPRAIAEQTGQILMSIGSRIAGAVAGGGLGALISPATGVAGAAVGSFAGPALTQAAQIVGPVALERAKNNGYTEPTDEDMAYAIVTAAGSGLLNAFGAKYLPGGEKAVGSFSKRLASSFLGEGLPEGIDALIQQVGETIETKKGIQVSPKQAIGEALIGGGAGAAATIASAPFTPEQIAEAKINESANKEAENLFIGNDNPQGKAVLANKQKLEQEVADAKQVLSAIESTDPVAQKLKLELKEKEAILAAAQGQVDSIVDSNDPVVEAERQQIELAKAITAPVAPTEPAAPTTPAIAAQEGAKGMSLQEVSESAIAAFPDMMEAEGGLLPLTRFTPDEQASLRNAGIVETATTSTGETYEGVNAEYLWQRRKQLQDERAKKVQESTTPAAEVAPPTEPTVNQSLTVAQEAPAITPASVEEVAPAISDETKRIEQIAIQSVDTPKKLNARLQDALDTYGVKNRKSWTIDFENKQLISPDKTTAIKWTTRNNPNEPESYTNQQTSTGKANLVKYQPAPVAETPAAAPAAEVAPSPIVKQSKKRKGILGEQYINKDWTSLTKDELPQLNRELYNYYDWAKTVVDKLIPNANDFEKKALIMELRNEITQETAKPEFKDREQYILAQKVAGELITGKRKKILQRAKERAMGDEYASWEMGGRFEGSPISVEAFDSNAKGRPIPKGYTKQGDVYVYQAPAVSETITPAAEVAPAEEEIITKEKELSQTGKDSVIEIIKKYTFNNVSEITLRQELSKMRKERANLNKMFENAKKKGDTATASEAMRKMRPLDDSIKRFNDARKEIDAIYESEFPTQKPTLEVNGRAKLKGYKISTWIIESDLGNGFFVIRDEKNPNYKKYPISAHDLTPLKRTTPAISETITPAEPAAKKPKLGEKGGVLIPSREDFIQAGQNIYEKGMEFGTWAKQMIQEFGDVVREFLGDVWQAVSGAPAKLNEVMGYLPKKGEAGAVNIGQGQNAPIEPEAKTITEGLVQGIDIGKENNMPINNKIESHIKNFAFVRGIFESASDRLRRAKFTKLATAIYDYYDQAQRRLGFANKILLPAFDEYSKQSKATKKKIDEEVKRFFAAQENKRDTAEFFDELNPITQKIVTAWQKFGEESGSENQRIGIKVFDKGLQRWRPIGKVEKFWPRVLKPEYKRALMEPDKYQKEYNEIVDALMKSGRIQTPEEAEAFISDYQGTGSQNDYFSGIEAARGQAFPEELYDYSTQVMTDYVARWAQHSSRIEQFGQKLGENSKTLWDRSRESTRDRRTIDYITAAQERVEGYFPNDPIVKGMSTMGIWTSGFQLGNFSSSMLNFFGGTTLNAMVGQPGALSSYLSSFIELRNLGRQLKDAREKGIVSRDLMNIVGDHQVVLESSGLAKAGQKTSDFLLKWSGFTPVEQMVRTQSMIIGKSFLRKTLSSLSKNPNSSFSKRALTWLNRNNIDADKLIVEQGTGPETDKLLRYFANISQGSYTIAQTPIFIDTPIGRFLFKYQKFSTQVMRQSWKNTFEPAWKAVTNKNETLQLPEPTRQLLYRLRLAEAKELGDNRKITLDEIPKKVTKAEGKALTIIPVMMWLGSAYVGGEVILRMRDMIFGVLMKGPNYEDIIRAFEDDEPLEALYLAFERAWYNLIGMGALGLIGNYAQFFMDLQDRERVKNPLDPPALSIVKETGTFIQNVVDQGKITIGDINDYLNRTLSAYRVAQRAYQTAASGLGYSDAPTVAEEMFRREVASINKYARRWAESAGLEYRTRRPSDLPTSKMTPINREISSYLQRGEPGGAAAYAKEYLNSLPKKERANAIQSIQSGARNRQPLRLGSGPMDQAEKTAFKKWLKEKVSKEKFDEIQKLDSQYQKNYRIFLNKLPNK